ncbi:uncharacterized protein Z518_09433 [Rhinocladiella mackenziei CBS 650.93]|uniref:D-xylose 1-dehydrogenase (NADP(+), D-xylono-1,5-lactone-forming) n=1 Tax=Rhinocladiella mackenziei CBS 650.93 TaxID=1442369 RepID=A0A0D2FI64_9EURO|nr:uncharacterized protein Z518_09433 [Rhinocladiella mackenziei CBS 650.93]KIX01707.1 hypothetical protein Z518_09433 [Rhinocladiella mackenziei CBS 650.93]
MSLGTIILKFYNWWNNATKIQSAIRAQKLSALSEATSPKFLRIGVLSAAKINFTAIFDAVATHPSVVIVAVASRDKAKADAQIAENKLAIVGECKSYGSYDALLDDPNIDAVYIPLPNGLHHKWTLAALEKGKHVLIEKPLVSNAREAREVREAARRSGKVALEAFHWRFHPSAHVVKTMLLSGEYGPIRTMDARFAMPAGVFPKDDIRFNYELGGGSCMDLTYVFAALEYFAARDATKPGVEFEVLEAKGRVNKRDSRIDDAMSATIVIRDSGSYGESSGSRGTKGEVKATVYADLAAPPLFGFIPNLGAMTPMLTIECEGAEIVFSNFMGPWVGHSITVTPVTRDKDTGQILGRGKKTVQKVYKGGPIWEVEAKNDSTKGDKDTSSSVGEDWWTTYRYQLEVFVRKIREHEEQQQQESNGYEYKGPWMSLDESVKVMEIIDSVYERAGLPIRGE